ncbi:MAG: hypothetical protein SFU27_10700, partial [Thermonemataceae bacterium]|nr:hypothetical protein [Thermonemataceae bacterium]
LFSAFVLAPNEARNTTRDFYKNLVDREWEKTEKQVKLISSWLKPEQIKDFKLSFEKLEKTNNDLKVLVIYKTMNNDFAQIKRVFDDVDRFYRDFSSFKGKNDYILSFDKITENYAKSFRLSYESLNKKTENLQEQIKKSAYHEKHKEYLYSSLKESITNQEQIGFYVRALEYAIDPKNMKESKIDFNRVRLVHQETPKLIGKAEEAYNRSSRWFADFANAESIVATKIPFYTKNISDVEKEMASFSNNKIFNKATALRKTDSLLSLARPLLNQAIVKNVEKNFVESYLNLEQLAPTEAALSQEFQQQKREYLAFSEQYEAINKDLKEVGDSKNIGTGNVKSSYTSAMMAQQLALQYAMAGNWAMANSHLKESGKKTQSAYNYAFKKSSPRSSTYDKSYSGSSSSSGYSKGSGSSYKSSSSSSGKSSGSSSSYSSSSKKSDSRSWSSSSGRKSSGSSSSSSSRRSDSRSWGSKRRK